MDMRVVDFETGKITRRGEDQYLDRMNQAIKRGSSYFIEVSTELNDKNGVEIFEGDIIMTPDESEDHTSGNDIWEVLYCNGSFVCQNIYESKSEYLSELYKYAEIIDTVSENKTGFNL